MSAGTSSVKSAGARGLVSAVLQVLTGLLGVAIGIYVLVASWQQTRSPEDPISTEAITQTSDDLRGLRRDIARLGNEQQVIRLAVARSPENLQTRLLVERLQNIERRQARIEQVILNNPARALELPLLRNDLDNAREVNAQSLTAIRASVDQIYDLNKWLLGGMAIGIIALAVSSFLTKKES